MSHGYGKSKGNGHGWQQRSSPYLKGGGNGDDAHGGMSQPSESDPGCTSPFVSEQGQEPAANLPLPRKVAGSESPFSPCWQQQGDELNETDATSSQHMLLAPTSEEQLAFDDMLEASQPFKRMQQVIMCMQRNSMTTFQRQHQLTRKINEELLPQMAQASSRSIKDIQRATAMAATVNAAMAELQSQRKQTDATVRLLHDLLMDKTDSLTPQTGGANNPSTNPEEPSASSRAS